VTRGRRHLTELSGSVRVTSGSHGRGGSAVAPTNVVFPTTTPPLGDGTVTLTWTPDPATCGATPPAAGVVTASPRFTG